MIQFNLLPDVKIQYLKARYRKRLAMTISFVVSVSFLVIFALLLLFVKVAQPHQMSAVSTDINSTIDQLKKTQDLDKILTVQNQLNSLPDLHDKKVISSRLFDYLVQVTPAQATVSDLTIDFTTNTLSIKGNADSLNTVNKFTDTLKFTDFKASGTQAKEGKAFNSVVLKGFSVTAPATGSQTTQTNKQITYEIQFAFDPTIFANAKDDSGKAAEVKLTVPKIITTRSETQQPGALFEEQPAQTQPGRTN